MLKKISRTLLIALAGGALAAGGLAWAEGPARGAANYSLDASYLNREIVEASSAAYTTFASALLVGPEAPVQTSSNYSLTLGELPSGGPVSSVDDWIFF